MSTVDNLALFHTKLDEFWKTEKYCDVTIQVKEMSFKCHKVVLAMASEYFDLMFSSNFYESKANNITIKEVDVQSFREVLRYVYTGDIKGTRENIFGVLRASHLFQLVPIQDMCVRYIVQHLKIETLSTQEIFEMFNFACLTEKNSIKHNYSQYIMQHFSNLYNDNNFLELSLDALNVLSSQLWYLLPSDESYFQNAVVKWLSGPICKEAVVKQPSEFMEFVGRMRIQNILKESLLSKFNTDIGGDNLSSTIENERTSNNAISTVKNDTLHMYLYGIDGKLQIGSIFRYTPGWKISHTMKTLCQRPMPIISIDDSLYCISSMSACNSATKVLTFQRSSSLAFENGQILKSPPTANRSLNGMCNIGNMIYVNDYSEYVSNWNDWVINWHEYDEPNWNEYDVPNRNKYIPNWNRTITSSRFGYGPIISGSIYMYNIEVDEWYPLIAPTVGKKLYGSDMCTHNNTLYLIGSTAGKTHIQTLDPRTPRWTQLTNFYEPEFVARSALNIETLCCTHEQKIYTLKVNSKWCATNSVFNVFDIVGGKWEKLKLVMQYGRPNTYTYRLLSYENLLWAFGLYEVEHQHISELNVVNYNALTKKWSPSPDLGSDLLSHGYSFLNAVVFKST